MYPVTSKVPRAAFYLNSTDSVSAEWGDETQALFLLTRQLRFCSSLPIHGGPAKLQ